MIVGLKTEPQRGQREEQSDARDPQRAARPASASDDPIQHSRGMLAEEPRAAKLDAAQDRASLERQHQDLQLAIRFEDERERDLEATRRAYERAVGTQ